MQKFNKKSVYRTRASDMNLKILQTLEKFYFKQLDKKAYLKNL